MIGDVPLLGSLIFGGCCSNAVTLEIMTKQLPDSGALLTLAQFLATTAVALVGRVQWDGCRPRFPHRVPLQRWIVQVVLYYATSMLNNMAFAYAIPMSVHIIFRSGGMVVNMLLGWIVDGKRYSLLQIASVLLVSVGVIVATLSANTKPQVAAEALAPTSTYATGIMLLFIALLSSGVMGIFQERTFRKYGRDVWHESLFFSHLFSLPLFLLHTRDIDAQVRAARATTQVWIGVQDTPLGVWIPSFVVGLVLNVLTQLLCINGVNRLTSRVSSLTVSLILVVRKALSLIISMVVLNHEVGSIWLWLGAAGVLIGTVGYTYGGMQKTVKPKTQ